MRELPKRERFRVLQGAGGTPSNGLQAKRESRDLPGGPADPRMPRGQPGHHQPDRFADLKPDPGLETAARGTQVGDVRTKKRPVQAPYVRANGVAAPVALIAFDPIAHRFKAPGFADESVFRALPRRGPRAVATISANS